MPRFDYRWCKRCGRNAKDAGPLSHTRLCSRCSRDELVSNVLQMAARSGPNFTKWRHAMIRCAGGVVSDSQSQTR
jgi:hypothetical protein